MSDEKPKEKPVEEGLPAYMGTFADLMSLLMCFFVLLLSFSEMDTHKYKMVVKSLQDAFGVQRQVVADAVPKGTSIIAQNFSPGEPKPTPLKVVRQNTMNDQKKNLKVMLAEKQAQETQKETEAFKKALKKEINNGLINVENQLNRIVIRIRQKGSFPSGEATLNPDFIPILHKIHDVLEQTSGKIAIAGYTDDVPIHTPRYRSNWELSTSRATSVVDELLKEGGIPAKRFHLEGYADTKPLVPNDSPENRAKNRRVEIIVFKSPVEKTLTRSINQLEKEHESVDSKITPLKGVKSH